MSLEACTACLQVLAAPGMPKQVYKEEMIDRLVGLVRFQLLHNVLVFYDAALCQAQRPELLNPGTCIKLSWLTQCAETAQWATTACCLAPQPR